MNKKTFLTAVLAALALTLAFAGMTLAQGPDDQPFPNTPPFRGAVPYAFPTWEPMENPVTAFSVREFDNGKLWRITSRKEDDSITVVDEKGTVNFFRKWEWQSLRCKGLSAKTLSDLFPNGDCFALENQPRGTYKLPPGFQRDGANSPANWPYLLVIALSILVAIVGVVFRWLKPEKAQSTATVPAPAATPASTPSATPALNVPAAQAATPTAGAAPTRATLARGFALDLTAIVQSAAPVVNNPTPPTAAQTAPPASTPAPAPTAPDPKANARDQLHRVVIPVIPQFITDELNEGKQGYTAGRFKTWWKLKHMPEELDSHTTSVLREYLLANGLIEDRGNVFTEDAKKLKATQPAADTVS